ncbi:hypothetical protein Sango_0350800 [Sesamum angolense]|uniref:DDE Tnp4 domain-containing protein n=1 Tax=Sesamum angolense TaxID=2727404 RepID=A0AAE1XA62_9LAMI|nr:hypothetical protein Sango_0350800 [Sesamum angolense]
MNHGTGKWRTMSIIYSVDYSLRSKAEFLHNALIFAMSPDKKEHSSTYENVLRSGQSKYYSSSDTQKLKNTLVKAYFHLNSCTYQMKRQRLENNRAKSHDLVSMELPRVGFGSLVSINGGLPGSIVNLREHKCNTYVVLWEPVRLGWYDLNSSAPIVWGLILRLEDPRSLIYGTNVARYLVVRPGTSPDNSRIEISVWLAGLVVRLTIPNSLPLVDSSKVNCGSLGGSCWACSFYEQQRPLRSRTIAVTPGGDGSRVVSEHLTEHSSTLEYLNKTKGWEGSAADSRVLRDAIHRPHGLRVPSGNYYLCDNGYTNADGFLTPKCGFRYHLNE